MGDDKKVDTWEWIKRLLAILGGAWIIFQFINWIIKDHDYQIVSTGKMMEFCALQFTNEPLSQNAIDKLSYEINGYGKLNDSSFINGINLISNEQNSLINSNLKYYSVFAKIEIANSGTKTLEKLELQAPFQGVFSVNIDETQTPFRRFENKIIFDDLKPGKRFMVFLICPSIYALENSTKIIHSNGSENIIWVPFATGIGLWFATHPTVGLIVKSIFSSFIILLIISLFQTLIDKLSSKADDNKESTGKER